MHRALDLAREGLYRTSPNPRVGCVIVSPDGELLGEGSTQKAGEAHAEVMALRDALANGRSVVGATVFVTLEPCSHMGRTGPCSEALISAGVARVVGSLADPNPLVSGKGFDRLRGVGIRVDVGLCAEEAREINLGFFSRMVRGIPWVRLKVAASLDGLTALPTGESQWITSQQSRDDGHAWRARACAVLTGIGTVLADNPRLDVRAIPTPRQPALVVLDSSLRTPVDAALFGPMRAVHIYCATSERSSAAVALADRARIVPALAKGDRVDLEFVLKDLAQQGINEVHVEAGAELNGAFLQQGLVDELLVYLAPMLVGPGAGMFRGHPLKSLSEATSLKFVSYAAVGPDLRVVARPQGRDVF